MWLGSGSLHSHDFLKQGPFEICHNLYKCDVLRNLVPFVQFKKREKHPWRGVTFSKVALKVTLLHGCFSRFLNCTNGTKSHNASQMIRQIIQMIHFRAQLTSKNLLEI